MKPTITQCLCVTAALFAVGGCGSHGDSSATAPSGSAGAPLPGMMKPAQQQAEIAKRNAAAHAQGGPATIDNGRPVSMNAYKSMLQHMTPEQQIEYAHKHPRLNVVPPQQH